MKPGARVVPYTVCRLVSRGASDAVWRRLAEMGVLPGTEVMVVRASPLGGPVELATEDGQSLALRAAEFYGLNWDVVALPLAAAPRQAGRFRVHGLLGQQGFRQRMQREGLVPGAVFERVPGRAYRLRRADGAEVVLGRGEAEKLQVEPIDG